MLHAARRRIAGSVVQESKNKNCPARRYDQYLYSRGLWNPTTKQKGKPQKKKKPERRRKRTTNKEEHYFPTIERPVKMSELRILVSREAAPWSEREVQFQYNSLEVIAAWDAFMEGIEEALGLTGSQGLLREGIPIHTLTAVVNGQSYVVRLTDGDKLVFAIQDGLVRDDDDDDESDDDSDEDLPEDVYERIRIARRRIRKALREADLEELPPNEVAEELTPEKATTKAEVLRRKAIAKDREVATEVAEEAVKAMNERKKKREDRVMKGIYDPDRKVNTYLGALDEIESEWKKRLHPTEGESTVEVRRIYRNAVRWLATNGLTNPTDILKRGAIARVFRYLEGPAGDDLVALGYGCSFFANLAIHDEFARQVLTSGGLDLALFVIHGHCEKLVDATTTADDTRSTAFPPPSFDHTSKVAPYYYGNVVKGDDKRQVAKRIAQGQRIVLNDQDDEVEPSSLQRAETHFRALAVVYGVVRSPATREMALPMVVREGSILEALRITLLYWSRFRIVATVSAGILTEIAKQNCGLRDALKTMGFIKLLQVAATRHQDAEDVKATIDHTLNLLATTSEEDSNDRQRGDFVGSLEHPPLDDFGSAYRFCALAYTEHVPNLTELTFDPDDKPDALDLLET